MPLYVIERNFAEQLEVTPDAAAGISWSTTMSACIGCSRSCRSTGRSLLPVRGERRGADSRGGAAREHPRRRDHRGDRARPEAFA